MRLLIRIVAVLIGAWLGFYALSAGFGQVGQSSNGHSGSTVHGGSYWPLGVLAFARNYRTDVLTKSGFMVGLGESQDEVLGLLRDLRSAQVDVATIGQYLRPTRRNLPVVEYIGPAQFDAYRDYALSIGFRMVFSGPLVRSSYMADHVSEQARRKEH